LLPSCWFRYSSRYFCLLSSLPLARFEFCCSYHVIVFLRGFPLFFFLSSQLLFSASLVTKHPFHIVTQSPYPFFTALSLLFFVVTLILSWNFFSPWYLLPSFLLVSYICFEWASNISVESTFLGCHTSAVRKGHCIGFSLFIISEVFFFLSWFWAYFHFALSPAVEIGSIWPPLGIKTSSPFTVPLLNTVILLASGASVTWASSSLTHAIYFSADSALCLTLSLGLAFLCCQIAEYYFSSFTISDSCYGSSFFMLTGFHGLHVFVGCLLLSLSLYRLKSGLITCNRFTSLLAAVWYWHFVDVVWLLLFLLVYIWGT